MSTLTSLLSLRAGGSFLLDSRTPAEIFTPEDLNEEQRQIAATAIQFAREEILPAAEAIEAKEPGVFEGDFAKSGRAGVHLRRYFPRIRRHGDGQDHIHAGFRSPFGAGELFNGIRRAHRDRHAAAGLVRHRGGRSSAICPSWLQRNGSGRMVCRRPAPGRTR